MATQNWKMVRKSQFGKVVWAVRLERVAGKLSCEVWTETYIGAKDSICDDYCTLNLPTLGDIVGVVRSLPSSCPSSVLQTILNELDRQGIGEE